MVVKSYNKLVSIITEKKMNADVTNPHWICDGYYKKQNSSKFYQLEDMLSTCYIIPLGSLHVGYLLLTDL